MMYGVVIYELNNTLTLGGKIALYGAYRGYPREETTLNYIFCSGRACNALIFSEMQSV